MKKSLKLVGIFMAVMIVGIVGGLSIYFLIANNKTYYIYDLRIVEPVADQGYYVYTDSEVEYTSMKNQVVNMTNSQENLFEIGVYAYTSTNTTQVSVTSSNTNVAEVRVNNGHMYVVYRGAGETTITAKIGNVEDYMRVVVFNNSAEEVDVFDDRYYGETYSTKFFTDEIVLYADGEEYEYRMETSKLKGTEYSNDINCELLKIDYSRINKDVFPNESDIQIDAINKRLILRCKKDTTVLATEIPIISYSLNEAGEIRTEGQPFVISAKIITYRPQFLQLVVSKNPNFDDDYVFMSTNPKDVSSYTDEEIEDNKSLLNDFLEYQIAESELATQNEFSTYNMYFSKNVTKVYFKLRMVYTNGDIVYLNPTTRAAGYNYTINPNVDNDNLKISADGSYYILELTQDEFAGIGNTYNLTVSYGELSHEFQFKYMEMSAENLEYFYSLDEETGVYTYKYWDPRAHFDNEIYDENGEIVGFGV